MKQRFTFLELIIVIALVFTVIVAILPAQGSMGPAYHAKCKSNLKNIGTATAAYFSESLTFKYPIKRLTFVQGEDIMEIAPEVVQCPLTSSTYVWLFSNTEFTGSAVSPLAGDSANHKKKPHRFRVFQDAHVE